MSWFERHINYTVLLFWLVFAFILAISGEPFFEYVVWKRWLLNLGGIPMVMLMNAGVKETSYTFILFILLYVSAIAAIGAWGLQMKGRGTMSLLWFMPLGVLGLIGFMSLQGQREDNGS